MIVAVVDDVPLAVQVEEKPPVVRVLGTVVSDVPFSEDLCAWLNEVNANRLRIGYAFGGITRSDTPSNRMLLRFRWNTCSMPSR